MCTAVGTLLRVGWVAPVGSVTVVGPPCTCTASCCITVHRPSLSFSCHQCLLFAVCSRKKRPGRGLAMACGLCCIRLLPVPFGGVFGEHELYEEGMPPTCLPNIVQRYLLCVHGCAVCSVLPPQSVHQQLPATSVRTYSHRHNMCTSHTLSHIHIHTCINAHTRARACMHAHTHQPEVHSACSY